MTEKIYLSPLYNHYFTNSSEIKNWEDFEYSGDFFTPLSKREPDFSVQNQSWYDTAQSIASLVAKGTLASYFLLPLLASALPALININDQVQSMPTATKRVMQLALGFFVIISIRYIIQRIIMLPLYPAQSRIVKLISPSIRPYYLNLYREHCANQLNEHGYIVREVTLEKNRVKYSGLLIGHIDTIDNQKWALQATGNMEPVEHTAADFAKTYYKFGFNVLLINGPSVGNSQGQATPKSMADAQEIGLRYIETGLKANKIVIAGRSLGGAAIGQAILDHEFKKDVKYLVIRQMTFDKVSNICGKIVGRILPPLGWLVSKAVILSGCEMDSVKVSRKLQELKIREVIVQATKKTIEEDTLPLIEDFFTDGPILADASLGRALISEKITEDKAFICLRRAKHMTNKAIKMTGPEIAKL